MPSEQEMVKKAHLWRMQNGWTIPTTVVTTEADRMLAQFALLERADARRAEREECAREVENLEPAFDSNDKCDCDARERIASALRAKLTPAPEAEKEQKNGKT